MGPLLVYTSSSLLDNMWSFKQNPRAPCWVDHIHFPGSSSFSFANFVRWTGPVIGGYLAKGAGWEWVFWLVAILVRLKLSFFVFLSSVANYMTQSGVLTILCLISIPETYAPVLLIRKAARLRKQTGNPKLHSVFDNPKSPLCTLYLGMDSAVELTARGPLGFFFLLNRIVMEPCNGELAIAHDALD
jgi:MFS family permease